MICVINTLHVFDKSHYIAGVHVNVHEKVFKMNTYMFPTILGGFGFAGNSWLISDTMLEYELKMDKHLTNENVMADRTSCMYYRYSKFSDPPPVNPWTPPHFPPLIAVWKMSIFVSTYK